MRFNRNTVIEAFREKIRQNKLVVACAAGNGLVAKLEDKNGADAIIVYNSGRFRMDGIASIAGNLPIGNANDIVYEMGTQKILHMVKNTPVVAGVYGIDPTRSMPEFLDQLIQAGFSGVINFPTVGKLSGSIRQELEQVGLGFEKEVQTLQLAAQKGLFTMAYCYNPQEARILARAGIDILVSHVGLTAGGEVGVRQVAALEETCRTTQEILSAALEERPDIIPLCHGGAIVSPEDVQQVIDSTCAVGFVGASSIERLPVEGSVSEIVRRFANMSRG